MRFSCILSFWMFLSEIKSSATDEIAIQRNAGQDVVISSYHILAQNNRKYFCRDPCKDRDVLVSSDRPYNGRFSLVDFMTGLFTVNITDLQESDSGIYWCGVDRVGIDTYHKVKLRVGKTETHPASTTGKVSEIQLTTTTDSVSTSSTSETSTFTQPITGLIKSTPEAFTENTVAVYPFLYAVVGLVIMVTALAVGLKASRCVSRTSTHIDNECNSDESNSVYENDLDERANATKQKPEHRTEDFENPEEPIYQNVLVNTSHLLTSN